MNPSMMQKKLRGSIIFKGFHSVYNKTLILFILADGTVALLVPAGVHFFFIIINKKKDIFIVIDIYIYKYV